MKSNQNPRLKFANPYRRARLTTATSLTMAPPNLRPKSNVNAKSKLRRKSSDPNPKKTKKRKTGSKLSLSKKDKVHICEIELKNKKSSPSDPYLKIPTPKTSSSPPDLKACLIGIKEYNKVHLPDNDSILATTSLPHTKRHEWLINSVIDDYIQCLSSYKNNKWTHLLNYETFDGPGSFEQAPRILIAIGGQKDNDKLQLANLSLIDWQAVTMKKKQQKSIKSDKDDDDANAPDNGDDPCPWYQPSTQNVHLRTFFGTVQRIFGWQFQQSDFNFNAGLNGFIKDLYAAREKEYGKVSDITIMLEFN